MFAERGVGGTAIWLYWPLIVLADAAALVVAAVGRLLADIVGLTKVRTRVLAAITALGVVGVSAQILLSGTIDVVSSIVE